MNAARLELQPTRYGHRIDLPNRDLGRLCKFGWFPVAGGVLTCLFMIGWIAGPAWSGIEMLQQGKWFGLLLVGFASLGLFGLRYALMILTLGIAMLRNRLGCTIQIRDKQIISHERFGWFGFKIKSKRDAIDSLYLMPLSSDSLNEESPRSGRTRVDFATALFPEGLYSICTNKRKGTPIAPGYPLATLQRVAMLLKGELDRERVGLVTIVDEQPDLQTAASLVPPTTSLRQPVSIVEETTDETEEVEYTLPSDSQLEVVEQGDSVVYRVPPAGLLKGTHGLFFFALIWNGFMAFATGSVMMNGQPQQDDLFIMIGVMSLFWCVGIGMLIAAIYLARQSAMIGVNDGRLFIERKTIFGTKWSDFEPASIASVHMGPSGMEVNERPVMHLKIQPVGKDAIGMFAQLTNAEINWLAQQLRRELGIQYQGGDTIRAFDLSGPIAPPTGSKVTVSQSDHQTQIEVPAFGIGSCWGGLLFGCLFMVATFAIPIYFWQQGQRDWMLGLFPLFATVIGSGLMAASLMYHTRRFSILATESQLTVQRYGFLSQRLFAIQRNEIQSVTVEFDGTRVNNRRYMHLAVLGRKGTRGKSFSLMSGRQELEIGYVGALIHQRLKLQPPAEAQA